MLGHEIGFDYCRLGAKGDPCRKIFDCWFDKFDIEEFMRQHFSDEELKDIVASGKDKMLSLIEIIKKTQQRMKGDDTKS